MDQEGEFIFSTNPEYWKDSPKVREILWNANLISGRYAQDGDSHHKFSRELIEQFLDIPDDLLNDPLDHFPKRGSLPHHDEIAVDDEKPGGAHILYDAAQYKRQFTLRKQAAIDHIRSVFQANWHNGAPSFVRSAGSMPF
jgi:hypothetical protein